VNPSDSPSTLPAPAFLTPVHPRETTVAPETALAPRPEDCGAYDFRHAGWHFYRTLTYSALQILASRAIVPLSRVQRFTDCGRTAWILRHTQDPNLFRIALDCCHDRFCVPCSQSRAQVVAENLSRKLGHTPHRLLTLTLRSTNDPLNSQLDRLLKSFKRLRSRTFWRERCDGGAALLELTRNTDTKLWHPHLHVIMQGSFIPHAALKAIWLDITGDSSILDIRLIRHRDHVIKYVSKYATKPASPAVLRDPDALSECIQALAGRKTIFAFGSWARWKLLDPHDSGEWQLYCHANALPFGFPEDLPLRQAIAPLFEQWAHHDGPNQFRVRAPPLDPDPDLPYER
jgi:hypothetical protein